MSFNLRMEGAVIDMAHFESEIRPWPEKFVFANGKPCGDHHSRWRPSPGLRIQHHDNELARCGSEGDGRTSPSFAVNCRSSDTSCLTQIVQAPLDGLLVWSVKK